MKINPKDKLILQELQKNSKQSMRQLSKKTGIPATTIHHKVKQFEKQGIIKAYNAILNADKLDKATTAFVLFKVKQFNIKKKEFPLFDLAEKLKEDPTVCQVYSVAGPYDLIVRIRIKDSDEIIKWQKEFFKNIKDVGKVVGRVETIIAFETYLETQRIKL